MHTHAVCLYANKQNDTYFGNTELDTFNVVKFCSVYKYKNG